MAESTVIKNKRDFTVAIRDNGLASSYTVSLEPGDLVINIPGPTVSVYLDRGQFGATPQVRYVDDQPMTWTLTGNLRALTDAAAATLNDILCGGTTGLIGSGWVSTLGANAEVKAFDVLITIAGSTHGDGKDHTARLKYTTISGSINDGDPATIKMSGTDFELYPTLT